MSDSGGSGSNLGGILTGIGSVAQGVGAVAGAGSSDAANAANLAAQKQRLQLIQGYVDRYLQPSTNPYSMAMMSFLNSGRGVGATQPGGGQIGGSYGPQPTTPPSDGSGGGGFPGGTPPGQFYPPGPSPSSPPSDGQPWQPLPGSGQFSSANPTGATPRLPGAGGGLPTGSQGLGAWPADVTAPGGWGASQSRPYRPGEQVGAPIGRGANGELVYGYSYGTRAGDINYQNPLTGDYTTWTRPPGYTGPDIPLQQSAGATPPTGAGSGQQAPPTYAGGPPQSAALQAGAGLYGSAGSYGNQPTQNPALASLFGSLGVGPTVPGMTTPSDYQSTSSTDFPPRAPDTGTGTTQPLFGAFGGPQVAPGDVTAGATGNGYPAVQTPQQYQYQAQNPYTYNASTIGQAPLIGGGTQGFNSGQDGLMQSLARQYKGPDATQNGLQQFDTTNQFSALRAQNAQQLGLQVGALQGSAGSLGQRFGTAMNQNEALLRSTATTNEAAQLANLQSQSFENAQGRQLQAGMQMQGFGQQNDLANQQVLMQMLTGNMNALNQAGQFNANAGQTMSSQNAQQGNIFNNLVMSGLSQAGGMQGSWQSGNAGLLGLLAGLGVPQQQPSAYPGAISSIGQIASLYPFLQQLSKGS